jgi:CRISPR-associated protein Csx10
MKRIQMEIKVLSPLAITRQKHSGGIVETETYIPGSVIRGAIASNILKRSGHQFDDLAKNGGDFQILFLGDNPAIFQNAYPATIQGNKSTRIQPEVRVVPATALSSKNQSGFKSQPNDPKHHGVFDTLIDRFCAAIYGHLYDPNCPTDGGRVEPFTGFYSQLNGKYYSHSASTRLLTRVGINRRRATSEEEILYSLEVLNESQDKNKNSIPVVFTGTILVIDELADPLHYFINSHQEELRLGGSTSRGLGRVKIVAKPPTSVNFRVRDRIQNFNEKLRKRWNEWRIFDNSVTDLPIDRTYFTIDLQSDTILTENWRRTTVISPEMLQQFATISDPSIRLEAAYSSYDYRSGWNSAWGLLKDVELITNKGGVYLFSTIEKESWVGALEKLEWKGIGDRTCEGFGQIQVCNEFHLIFREDAV